MLLPKPVIRGNFNLLFDWDIIVLPMYPVIWAPKLCPTEEKKINHLHNTRRP